MKIGDRVLFTLAADIEAIIVGIMDTASGREFKVAWIQSGERKTDWVMSYEIEEKKE